MLDKLPEDWHAVLTAFVLPLRHYESGRAADRPQRTPVRLRHDRHRRRPASPRFDRIGNAQLLSLIGLALAGGAATRSAEAKKNWLYAPQLQGLRRMIEELLVEPDWAVGLSAWTCSTSRCTPCSTSTSTSGPCSGVPGAYSLLARHFHDWFTGHRKWLNALYKAWTADPGHGEANREVLGEIVARWYPRACEAVRTYAGGIAELAGSASIMGAAERSFAELAASLTKVGVPYRPPRERRRERRTQGPAPWASTCRTPRSRGRSSTRSKRTTPTRTSPGCPGWCRSSRPRELVIRRETVEQRMGREWETHEFQLRIVSYSGNIAEWDDDEIVIKWEHWRPPVWGVQSSDRGATAPQA